MKNNHSFFSIVIPTLNEEGYLPTLLNDLKNQTFTHFEVIVVDGNSDDKTVQKAKKFKKHLPIKIVQSKKRNVCIQRNLGANKSKSDWLIFMDADNRIPDYFLQGIKYQTERQKVDFFTTHIKPDGSHQLDLGIARTINLYYEAQKYTKKPSALESLMGCRKSAFIDLGGFDPKIKWGEGAVLLSKAVRDNYKFRVYKNPLYTFSFRRIRTQGKMKFFRNTAQLLLNQVFDMPLSDKKISQLYPMEGGGVFNIDNKPKTNLENIFKEVLSLSSKQFMQKIKPKKKLSLIEKVESFLKN